MITIVYIWIQIRTSFHILCRTMILPFPFSPFLSSKCTMKCHVENRDFLAISLDTDI